MSRIREPGADAPEVRAAGTDGALPRSDAAVPRTELPAGTVGGLHPRSVRGRISAHVVPTLVALAGLSLTAVVTTLSHLDYLHSEHQVLALEANLTRSALAVGPVDLERRLGKAVTEASLTHGSGSLFDAVVATSVGGKGPLSSAVLYALTPRGPKRLASAGGPPVLQTRSPVLARLCQAAVRTKTLAVTRLVGPHLQRFAYAMAAAPPGGGVTYVAYGEQVFPAGKRSSATAASTAPNLNFAIYFGRTMRRAALVESSAPTPLAGVRKTVLLPFGDRVLTVVVAPRTPLIGTLAAAVAWIFLALGLIVTGVATLLTAWLTRRRRTAERTASISRSLYHDQRAVAETLQRALLPRHLPQPEGFEVAARYRAGAAGVDVGGDWYDVIVRQDELFFSLGDVSGRGLEAAVVMAQLRHVISAHGFDGAGPAAALEKLTRMVSLERHGRFATVLCGRVDLATGALTLANAGHVTPLIVADGGATVLDVPPDPPVGVGTTYRTHELRLAPGQTFLATTDGLVERRGEAIDQGIERLRATVDGDLGLDELLDTVLATLVPDGAHDDVALLAIRRAPMGPASAASDTLPSVSVAP